MRPSWLLVIPLLTTTPAAAEAPSRVITNTQEYCALLARRVVASGAAAQEPASSLAALGIELCGSGLVRSGIAKLRHVLRAARTSTALPPTE